MGMWTKEKREAPFDEKGNLLHYPANWGKYEWVDIKKAEFTGTLTFKGFERGRSAAYALFESEVLGRKYCMFLTDLAEAIPHLSNGSIYGNWTFSKRGTNYGIKLKTNVGM